MFDRNVSVLPNSSYLMKISPANFFYQNKGFFLAILFLLLPFFVFGSSNGNYINPIRYSGSLSFSVVNDSTRIEQLEVWLPKLLEWDSQRNIKIHKITPAVDVDTTDSEGKNAILYWLFKDQPLPGGSITMRVDFSFTCYEVNFQIDPAMVGAYDKNSDLYQQYIKAEPYIQANDPLIVKLAKKIIDAEKNPYFQARKIFDWMLEHIRYQLVPGLKGDLFMLENSYGECGDYSALFVSLCRAAGIPARPVVGFWASPFSEPHVWAEFYLPSYGWLPVDVSQADGWGDVDSYCGKMDNRRVILSKGYNIKLIPEIKIKSLSIFQMGAWWYEGQEGGVHADIFLCTKAESIIENDNQNRVWQNSKYGLQITAKNDWEIAAVGGRGNYHLIVELWNKTRDSRIYLYGREWRENEPQITPAEISAKDIEFFKKNSPRFILLDQGPETFDYVAGHGFLAIMASLGLKDYYTRFIYFTKFDLIFWLIFQSTEQNFMRDNAQFIEIANSLRLLKPEELPK